MQKTHDFEVLVLEAGLSDWQRNVWQGNGDG